MPSQPDLSHYPAQKARQGEIILRRPWQRAVFIGGLIGCAVLLLVALLAAAGTG